MPAPRRPDRRLERLLRELETVEQILVSCSIASKDLDMPSEFIVSIQRAMSPLWEIRDQVYEKEPGLRRVKPIWPRGRKSSVRLPTALTREQMLNRLVLELDLSATLIDDASHLIQSLSLSPGDNVPELRKSLGLVRSIRKEAVGQLPKRSDPFKQAWRRLGSLDIPERAKARRPADRGKGLERLNNGLNVASTVLGDCAGILRDVDLEPKRNIRRIGKVLEQFYEVQAQIWDERPELVPDFLKDVWEKRRKESEESA